jgi:lipopolysaccharide export system permease protein
MILTKYILKEHIGPFFGALIIITFLFLIDFMVHLMDSVLSKGLPTQIVLEVFVLNLAWMLALSIPMAVLVASLMAFGRWSADHEITAIKAAGIKPFRLMLPVLLAGGFLMLGLIVFNNWVLPESNHRAASLMSDISRKKPHAFIDAGKLLTDFPGVQLWIDRIDKNTGKLYGIQIFEFEGKGKPKLIQADSATMEYGDMGSTLILNLQDGENHIPDAEDANKYFRIRFRTQELFLSTPDDRLQRRERKHRGDREMPIQDMLKVVYEAGDRQVRLIDDNAKDVWRNMDMIVQFVKGDTSAYAELLAGTAVPDTSATLLEEARAIRFLIVQEKGSNRKIERILSRIDREERRIAQYWVEIHKKFSIPVACVVFVLIGAPLGIMARKGGIGTGVVYSLVFFVLYWAFLIGGENMADKLLISPELAMWSPNILIGVLGVLLTYKMSADNYSGNSKIKNAWQAVLLFFTKKRRSAK